MQRRVPLRIVRLDHRLFAMVARTRTPWLDRALPALSRAANNSKLWLAIAAILGLRGGLRERRAALRGVGSIAVTSAIVNNGMKRLTRRPRPSMRHVPAVRRLSAHPATTSFPSGHAASAFAFAVGASSELPGARVPLVALASAVAYSRVYVGVHYPLDVMAGAAAGAGLAYGSRLAFPVRRALSWPDDRAILGAMSEEQEQLVRQGIRAVNERDIEAIVAMTGPEAEYELVGGFADIVGQTVLRGPEGVRRFYTDWFATFTTTHVEPTSFLEAGGDKLLVLSDVEVTAEGSEAPVKLAIGQLYSFKDGAISRVASYYDPKEALAAAGLSKQGRGVS